MQKCNFNMPHFTVITFLYAFPSETFSTDMLFNGPDKISTCKVLAAIILKNLWHRNHLSSKFSQRTQHIFSLWAGFESLTKGQKTHYDTDQKVAWQLGMLTIGGISCGLGQESEMISPNTLVHMQDQVQAAGYRRTIFIV